MDNNISEITLHIFYLVMIKPENVSKIINLSF